MLELPAAQADPEAVLRLWHAHQGAVLGRPDGTLDDVREALADPDLHPASVVVAEGERLVACALAFPAGGSGHVDADVVVHPEAGDALLESLLRRMVAAASGEHVRVDQPCYRQDERTARVLRAVGFVPATSFHRMRRALDEAVEVPVAPGVQVERWDEETDEALRRAHRLHQSTFVGHFGFEPRSYRDWLAAHRAKTVRTGPTWFATLDGDDAGFLQENDQFVEDEDAGYVHRLGVEAAARGRGVAKAMLLSSFAAMRERGRSAALLHVDSANATGATRLYESVGMSPVLVMDIWRWSGS